MGYTINYADITDKFERDRKAVEDTKDYLGEERFNLIVRELQQVLTPEQVDSINMMFAFAGISGLPFHAMMRKYCLYAYRQWMAAEPNPIPVDEHGF